MKLLNPTDDELNAAFAEKVAGWTRTALYFYPPGLPNSMNVNQAFPLPPFTTSADAVLPFTKGLKWTSTTTDGGYVVRINPGFNEAVAVNKDFAAALAIALLRAHGVVVEFAP